MKLSTTFFLAIALAVSTAALSQTITLAGKDLPMSKIVAAIEQQTGYFMVGNKGKFNQNDKLSIDVKDMQLITFLELIFKGRPYQFEIKDKNIFIREKKKPGLDAKPPFTIRGRVVDKSGQPVAGAALTVKGSSRGTTTNAGGYFELSDIDENATLLVSGVSIEASEVRIERKRELVIVVATKVESMNEVVISKGYYFESRKLSTGSVGRITAKEIEKQPVSNVLAAMQGRVAGVVITQQTGIAGGNFNVQIRGQNSLRNTKAENGNDPLYIVDGVPFISSRINVEGIQGPHVGTALNPSSGVSPLNSINPIDIESIEILKDADATAIYGSKGANGVILITTKKGKKGDMLINANVYTGIGTVTRKMDLLNTQQYIEMRKEAFKNDGITIYPSFAYDVNGIWDQNRYTDWQEELIGGSANFTDAQINVTGGSAGTQYRIGGGYHKESTVFPGDFSDKRISYQSSLSNVSQNQKFRSLFSVNYSYGVTNLIGTDLTGIAMTLAPNAPSLYNSDGDLNWENETFANPLQYLKKPYKAITKNLIGNATFSYEILRGLILKANMGYTSTIFKENNKVPISSYTPGVRSLVQNRTSFGSSEFNSWILEPQISYQRTFGDGIMNILIGSTFQDQESDQIRQIASGFLSESLMDNVSAVPSASVASAIFYSNYRYNALFGRLNYNWKEKYLVNLTVRRDGSSRFGPNKQFANFAAIGTGWIFSEEAFFKQKMRFLSYGKLRMSYGTTGNDQIPNYQFLDAYTVSGQYQGETALNPSRLFNPDFRWETNKKMEVGIELSGFKNRIFFTANYYRNRSSNQLVGYTLPPTAGYTSVQYNLQATVQNTGWEFEINSKNINNKEIEWTTHLNFTIPRNKLISFPNLETSPSYSNKLKIGEPLNIFLSYIYKGVNLQTGVYEVEDVDGNGLFNQFDMQKVNFKGQYFYGGLQNNISYKRISVDFLFQFVKQQGQNYLYSFSPPGGPGAGQNQPTFVMSRWRESGDHATIQQFTTSKYAGQYNLFKNSDAFITDASFIRLKNISVSYQIDNRVIEKAKIRSVRLYIQCQNLLTITGYKGLDPENQGISLPPLRTLTAGIQLTL